MKRSDFLKGLGFVGLAATGLGCTKDNDVLSSTTGTTTGTTSGTTTGSTACTVSPTETIGPYPTSKGDPTFYASSSYIRSDIRDSETGVPLTVNFTVKNTNASCAVVSGAFVEVWHCNRLGYYSEFESMTAYDFLRGKQATDANGGVTFKTVYPGWYSGRAPHIHVQVYTSAGVSKLITQVAFIESVSNAIYTGSSLYTGKVADTTNARDGIFSDSLSANMCDSLTGSISAGYLLNKTLYVAL